MYIPITGLAAAFCGLLLLVLGLRISVLRLRGKVALGDGGNTQLLRAIRVHGNNTEHMPIFLVLCLIYEVYAGGSGFLIATVAVFLLARLLFSIGLSLASVHPLRRLGAGLTFACQAVLPIALIAQILQPLRA